VPSDGADAGTGAARSRPAGWVVAVVVGILVLDQCTKAWAVVRLDRGAIWLVGDDVGLRLSRNPGGAFSLFQGYTPLLAVVAIVFSVVLARAVTRTRHPLTLVGLALVLGGALGNLVDRLTRSPGVLRGAVVDFVAVGSFPTFNVADAAITVGAVLLVVAILFPVDAPDGDAPDGDAPDGDAPAGIGTEEAGTDG
jgi:signal peptidase II